MAQHHGMPMLDIKCQSLQPDVGRGSSATLFDGVRWGRGSTAGTPQGSLCGDNTSLIEFCVEKLASHFWVKAKTRPEEEEASSRQRKTARINVGNIEVLCIEIFLFVLYQARQPRNPITLKV